MKDNDKQKRKKKRYKKPIKWETLLLVVGFIALMMLSVDQAYKKTIPNSGDINYSEFKQKIDNNEIKSANIIDSSDTFTILTTDGKEYSVINPKYDEFKKDLLESGIEISSSKSTLTEAIANVILAVPMTAVAFILIYFVTQSLGGQTTTLFKVFKPEDIITFDDVAGMSETKREVHFAVSQLKNVDKLKELGARPCRGIILEGPPGTGKTLLAKAIAGEAGVPFISTSGADFVEVFAGLGAARVRSLWSLAMTNAPCVLFIDEIDAVGRRRSGAGDGASTEANQTLNALLQRMDGLGTDSGIFVVGATNRISDLDPALLRPGRFDKHMFIGPPSSKEDRDEIINIHLKNKKVSSDFDFDGASKLMFGLSGAEIEQVLNEAVMVSIQYERDGVIETEDIDKAVMKLVSSGVSIKHTSDSDKEISAVHEAGHTIINLALNRKISKVSILPYSSGIGGMTIEDSDNKEDKRMKTRKELINDLKVLLAGREAEELLLGDTSIGCSNDIERATVLAFRVLNNFAMSDSRLINIMALSEVGINLVDTKDILNEVNGLLTECKFEVDKILSKNKDSLIKIKDELLRSETIIDIDTLVLEVEKEKE